jgi:hypothetical protein
MHQRASLAALQGFEIDLGACPNFMDADGLIRVGIGRVPAQAQGPPLRALALEDHNLQSGRARLNGSLLRQRSLLEKLLDGRDDPCRSETDVPFMNQIAVLPLLSRPPRPILFPSAQRHHVVSWVQDGLDLCRQRLMLPVFSRLNSCFTTWRSAPGETVAHQTSNSPTGFPMDHPLSVCST